MLNLDYLAGMFDHGGIFSIVVQSKYHRAVITLPLPHAITMDVQNLIGGHMVVNQTDTSLQYLLNIRPREFERFLELVAPRLIVKTPALEVIKEFYARMAAHGSKNLTIEEFNAREALRRKVWGINHPLGRKGFKPAEWPVSA